MGSGEGSTMRNFIVCTVHLIARMIKSRRLRWARNVARMEEGRSAFKILTGKFTLESPRRRWKDNVRIEFKEIDVNVRNWIESAQDRDY